MSQPDDEAMAAAFADFLGYRDAMSILNRYQKGFQVVMCRGWNADLPHPTYQVSICKINGDKPVTSGGHVRDWVAEGSGAAFLAAAQHADKRAQKYLTDDREDPDLPL